MTNRTPRAKAAQPAASAAPLRAAIYCRISSDREGRELGVDRQEASCREVADRAGFRVVEVFIENDTGASTRSRKPRPFYDQLIAGARTGQWDVIVAYSTSRLTRRPLESESLIGLYEEHGTQFAYAVSSRFDLSTADGRMMARIAASIDAAEAERTAERVRDSKAQAATNGWYRGGPRPFGYEKDGVTVRQEEAAVVREATTAILAGRSLSAVARELNERGVRTSTGNTWNQVRIRDVVIRPRNAGLLHRGRVDLSGRSEIVGPAAWPAIVDQDSWAAVCSILLDTSRRSPNHTSEPRWLGGGLYLCGLCGAPLRAIPHGGTASRKGPRRHYYCCTATPHLGIMTERTDDYLRAVVAELVRDPRIVAAMLPSEGEAVAQDRERRNVLSARLDSFETDYAAGHINGAQLAKARAVVEAELRDVSDRLSAAMRRSAMSPVLSAVDPGAAFLSAPVDIQRAVLAAAVTVQVMPVARRGSAWSANRLRLTPVAEVPIPEPAVA